MGTSLTRTSSSQSSALSNIDVAGPATAMDIDSASEPLAASTPPTSVSDARSTYSATKNTDEVMQQPEQDASERRSKRARPSVNYNLKSIFEPPAPVASRGSRNTSGLSGRTLVDRQDEEGDDEREEDIAPFGAELDDALNQDWKLPADSPRRQSPRKLQRRASVKDRVMQAASTAKSALGKRTRDMMESSKRRLKKVEELPSPGKGSKLLKELDTGKGGLLDELDLDAVIPYSPAKKAKTSKAPLRERAQPIVAGPLQKTSTGNKVKKWQEHGLYAGQALDFDPNNPRAPTAKTVIKKQPESSSGDAKDENEAPTKKRSHLGFHLPMFGYLDEDKTRSFRIPFDVYAPAAKVGEKPKDWHKLNKNRLIGDAKDIWAKKDTKNASTCVCQKPENEMEVGCDETCLNRIMQYECDDNNCNLGADCNNRPISHLNLRLKKGGLYDVGVEVIKTEQRGHGVRAARSYRPGEVIMEYTGEIVTEEECQRRMAELYKDKSCYYLMELERNLVIDGTKGSMARFINHSCSPNCEVRMLKVNGTPRMAVFAGDSGIMTGEELSYDYNFDNFGETRQACHCGATNCRGYLGPRLNADQKKKMAKEEAEKQRLAEIAAQKAAQKERAKQQAKDDRGPSWTGWALVDDPEVRAKLIEEKKLKEEREKSSSRAQRLAARRGSLPPQPKPSPAKVKKAEPKRRKTEEFSRKTAKPASADEDESDEDVKVAFAKAVSSRKRPAAAERRTTSTGSKFKEEIHTSETERPKSRGGIKKTTTVSVKSKSVEIQRKTTTTGEFDFDGDEDEVIALAKPAAPRKSFSEKISNAVSASLGRGASRMDMADEEDDEEEEEEAERVQQPPRKKLKTMSHDTSDRSNDAKKVEKTKAGNVKAGHGGGIRSKVMEAVRSGTKSLKQSTLNFPKLG